MSQVAIDNTASTATVHLTKHATVGIPSRVKGSSYGYAWSAATVSGVVTKSNYHLLATATVYWTSKQEKETNFKGSGPTMCQSREHTGAIRFLVMSMYTARLSLRIKLAHHTLEELGINRSSPCMLNRKKALTIAGVLILVTLAIFLLSHQTPPETVVTYKAVTFSPKTDTQTDSPSYPSSDVEVGIDPQVFLSP